MPASTVTTRVPLIIPVENQVRELDPKLLLACIVARRGHTSIIGSHRKIDFRIASLPRSLYRLWREYPAMPQEKPIHITGNPRGDLLRPDMCTFYADDAEALRKQHGKFILLNTNFNHVNAFFPGQNLFKPAKNKGGQGYEPGVCGSPARS